MSTAAPLGSSSGAVSEAVARAEALLASFWSSPDGAGAEPATAKVRASTLNYVVICAPQDAEAQREATERLSQTHGGRTLLLTMSGRIAPWDLLPDIHAVCRLEGSVPVCYDRVDLTFGAVAASRAASVVHALALPELTTIVEVAAGAPTPLVDSAAGKFHRLIVDSARMSAGSIARIVRSAPCPVADRAMVRTYAWRELCARFFDDASPALHEVRRVEIRRTAADAPISSVHDAASPGRPGSAPKPAGGQGIGAQDPAALILGWLGSRLGWTFTARNAARDVRGAPIEIVLTEDEREDFGPAQLTAIRLLCNLGGEPLECAIEREGATPDVRWTMRGARHADREHALGHKDETWVTIKAIDATEGDAVTKATLLAAADWEAHR